MPTAKNSRLIISTIVLLHSPNQITNKDTKKNFHHRLIPLFCYSFRNIEIIRSMRSPNALLSLKNASKIMHGKKINHKNAHKCLSSSSRSAATIAPNITPMPYMTRIYERIIIYFVTNLVSTDINLIDIMTGRYIGQNKPLSSR